MIEILTTPVIVVALTTGGRLTLPLVFAEWQNNKKPPKNE